MTATKSRVLAAEDSPTQAVALRAHLEAAGFEVSVTGNGAEALAVLERETFDLVVSDVVMPDVDGYELCRRVKEIDPGLPVILLTSLTDPMDVVRALSAGADNFLRKPYQAAELVQRSQSMLYNKELRSSGAAQMGLELFFLGRRFMINADRGQILDLLVSTFEDLVGVNNELKAREEELAKAHEDVREQLAKTATERDRLHTVLGAVPEGMVVVNANDTIVEVNDQLAQLLGLTKRELIGKPYWEAVEFVDHAGVPIATDEPFLQSALRAGKTVSAGNTFDLFVRRRDGGLLAILLQAAPITNAAGGVMGAVATVKDIEVLAAHDPVTSLPGHAALVDRLATTAPSDGPSSTGLLVVTVDRFDRFRESLPADAVDAFVATIADRLREALTSDETQRRAATATPAYLGNAELAIVLTEIADEVDLIRLGEFLVDQLAGPIDTGGLDVAVTVTIAGSLVDGGDDPAALVSGVAAAARRSSAEGGNRVTTSDPALHATVLARLQRESELRTAIATGQLVVHYQPEIRLRDGQPTGVEALVRWQHPEHGLLGAGEIIPAAIESGLIVPLGWRVLEDACVQVAEWRRSLPNGDQLRLSVNLAAEQLAEPDVASIVARITADAGLDPWALTLEVTEVGMMRDPAGAARRLQEIKAMGVKVAIDDFGTGYSSLLQLRQLPIDVLKIDQAFLAGMTDDPQDAAIVAGTIRLARTLGLEVVAEGVETLDQLVQLRVLGCDAAQGYHWSRPVPAQELAAWWAQNDRGGWRNDAQPTVVDDVRDDDTIAYLVHELRTPLTVVLGFAELLADTSEDVPTELAAIVRNARELNSLLASVGETRAALEGGMLSLRWEPCDIAELVRTLASDLSRQLDRDINVHVDAAEVVSVDADRIAQAITNLLTNAAKFSPIDAPIAVSVSQHDDRITITVRDHGPGIPEHRRPELFRRFSRLGSRTKGMGVGLYLSRLIVDAHGGTLRHDPAPGGGAMFTVELPRSTGQAAASPARTASTAQSTN